MLVNLLFSINNNKLPYILFVTALIKKHFLSYIIIIYYYTFIIYIYNKKQKGNFFSKKAPPGWFEHPTYRLTAWRSTY